MEKHPHAANVETQIMLHSPTFTHSNHRRTMTHQDSSQVFHHSVSFLPTLPCHLFWLQHVPIFCQMICTTCLLCHPEKMTNPLTLRLSHTVRHSHLTHQTIPKKGNTTKTVLNSTCKRNG